MRLLPVIISLLSFSLNAHDLCGHNHHPALDDLLTVNKAINWVAASDEDIRQAHCTRKDPFTDLEMKEWMNANQSSSNLNKKINGISFENESQENLESFKHLTTFVDIMGNLDPEEHKDFSSRCKKVDCAIKEIFGESTGTQLLYMQRRFGFNGSHIIKDSNEASAWTRDELDTVILALSDFPDGILPIEASRTLIHAPRNQTSGGVFANAFIEVFDLWNSQTPEQRRSTIVHELGHVLSMSTKSDFGQTWMDYSGWTRKTKIVGGEEVQLSEASRPETVISLYGLTNEREDMAESVVAYRYNPLLLKEASPEKYDFIKKTIFDDVEFTSKEACTEPKRFSDTLRNRITEELKTWNPTPDELRQIANRCTEMAIYDLASKKTVNLNSPSFQNCYAFSIGAHTEEIMKEKLSEYPHAKFLGPMIRNAKVDISPEKLKTIIERAQHTHLTDLKSQIGSIINDSDHCQEEFLQYAFQSYDEKILGINTYRLRNELTQISQMTCGISKKSEIPKYVETLFK